MEIQGTLRVLNPSDIKISLRQRQDFDKETLDQLKETIRTSGQLQPILVDNNLSLIAGERRLKACTELGIPIKAFVMDRIVSTEDSLLYEILENFQRQNFTPAEEMLAIQAFHLAMVAKHGQALPSRRKTPNNPDSWSQTKTAQALGITQSTVHAALRGAEFLRISPESGQADSRQEIFRRQKKVEHILSTLVELQSEDEDENGELDPENFMKEMLDFQNSTMQTYLPSLKKSSVDVFILDPPWGINITEIKTGLGGGTGKNLHGALFDDSATTALPLYEFLAKETFRLSKPTSQGFVFCGPEFYPVIREMFLQQGWNVYIKPLIWHKPSGGQTNCPQLYPVSSYEMFLFIRREKAKLFVQGKRDVFSISGVAGLEKTHISEKPSELINQLLEMVAIEGMTLLDTCVGSGVSLQVGLERGLVCKGCESNSEIFSLANKKLQKTLKEI